MCFIFLSPHPTYTPLLLVPLPLSLFLDSLSPSCISCGVYVQFGPDWKHIGKTACHLNEVTVIQMGGWVVRRGISGEAVLSVNGQSILLTLPACPLAPSRLLRLSNVVTFILESPPPRFIHSFKDKFIFHLSLLMVLTQLMFVNTASPAAKLQRRRASRTFFVCWNREGYLCLLNLCQIFAVYKLSNIARYRLSFNKQEVLTVW